ncbi:hypothetical protein H4R34_002745 [Dimargaris verticillata]|uniref:Uncharacterized protein n=1 Tax=Dimargaris verticillata TaxID=2761393 RepID=A0A9W8B3D4_9FUNG|nr:hypothetical protein H4R34_002745 [Dimargaris verticillata]
MYDVQGKVAVITGAASGFGKLLAQRLVAKGCRVVLGDINDKAGEALAQAINHEHPHHAMFQHCDVTQPSDIRLLFDQAVTAYGQADVMVNNAGIPGVGDFFDARSPAATMDAWNRVVDINLRAVLYGTQYAVHHWMERKRSGVVVNVSSASAFVLLPFSPVYAATKAAVQHFTSNCLPLSKKDIRVNAVAPFFSKTALVTNALEQDPALVPLVGSLPMVAPDLVVDAFMRCIEDEKLRGKTLSVLPRDGVQIYRPVYPKL